VTGRPMRVDDILAEIRRLAKVIKTHRRVVAA
jgi:hypothetical protein